MKPTRSGLTYVAAAGQHLARAVMEVEVQELQDVFDFVAAHLALLESIAGGDGAVGARASADAAAAAPGL